jgi:hypothetical protein
MEQQIQSNIPALRTTLGEVPAGQSFFAVMGREGDTKYMWDKNNAAEVEVARSTFNTFVKDKKYLAFKVVGDGTKGEQVRDFDPNHERYIFAPAMVGG